MTTRRLLLLLNLLLLLALAGCSARRSTPTVQPAATPTGVMALTPTAATRATPLPPQPTATLVSAADLTTATPSSLPTSVSTLLPPPIDLPPTPVTAALPEVMPAQVYQVKRLLVGPGQPGRLYAWLTAFDEGEQSAGRLLVSDDLGVSWQRFAGGDVRPVGMDYASGTLYGATADGLARWDGAAWQPVAAVQVNKLLVGLDDPQTMWSEMQGEVGRSTDGGITWQVQPANGVPLDLFLVPGQPGYLFLAGHVWGQHFLSRSTGNGQWDLLPKPDQPGEAVGTWRDIRGVAVDGATGDVYVALANQIGAFNPLGSQLWRTNTLGAADRLQVTWTLLGDYGPTVQLQLLAAGWNPSGAGLALYANLRDEYCPPQGGTCDPEPPWVLHRSLDGGQSWQPLTLPQPLP